MKRPLLHIAFWVAYLLQDIALVFLLDRTRWPDLNDQQRIFASAANCIIAALPKVILTYFILYRTLNNMLRDASRFTKNLIYSAGMLIACLLLYRFLIIYVIEPYIYHWTYNLPDFFDPVGFLVALMDVGFACGMAIVIKLVRLQLQGKEMEKNLIREKLETELKFLRNQTNPHFLFNTLNNIYALARKKSDDTATVVLKLSKLLRFMLYESRKPFIKIGDEIRILEDYIDLEKLRYNDRLSVNFDRCVDDETNQVAPLLLLPFVENAFKHGVGESRFASCIQILLHLRDNQLQFQLENSKEDTGSTTIDENIGLGNVRRQLELMYRDYSLQLENEPCRFKVTLNINLLSCNNISVL